MALIVNRLREFLDKNGAYYGTMHHPYDATAQETAAHTHTPGREFAKVVVVHFDSRFAMVVLPAHHRIDWGRLKRVLGSEKARLATEDEMRVLFPDCDVGAEPPFGALYGMPTYLSAAMVGDERITFNAGTHEEIVRMWFQEYRRLAQPIVVDVSWPA